MAEDADQSSVEDTAAIVLANLRRRAGEIASGKTSDLRTALVLQGGGMRAIYAAGAALALAEHGLGEAFDHVLGSSAGAIHAAYFVSGRPRFPVDAYIDDLSGPPFIDFCRLNMVLDLDFLIEEVMRVRKPLDTRKLAEAHAKLHIVMTNYQTGKADLATNRDVDFEPYAALKASSAIPIIYDKPAPYRDQIYVDGGISEYVPVIRALDAGCNNLVVVLTRPLGWRRREPHLLKKLFRRILFRRYPQAIIDMFQREDRTFNRTMDILEGKVDIGRDVRIVTVVPKDDVDMVSRVTTDRERLRHCAAKGGRDMVRELGLN
jgi:predicted patatin/cPLA2 family phospholipase